MVLAAKILFFDFAVPNFREYIVPVSLEREPLVGVSP